MARLPKINTDRLRELEQLLRKVKPKQFNMCRWGHSLSDNDVLGEEDYKNPKCHTSGCAFGTAAVHKPFVEQGLSLVRDGGAGSECTSYHVEYKNERESFGAAMKFFGLTRVEAHYLFDPNYYSSVGGQYGIKPKQVADRIEWMLDQGIQHWSGHRRALETAIECGWVSER